LAFEVLSRLEQPAERRIRWWKNSRAHPAMAGRMIGGRSDLGSAKSRRAGTDSPGKDGALLKASVRMGAMMGASRT